MDQELADAAAYVPMLQVDSPCGSTFLSEMIPLLPLWKCDVKSKIRLHQLMHIYLKNISANFFSDPIWNDGALGFFWRVSPQQQDQQDKKALLSQRRPRDAPNIWVPWKVSRVLANAPGYFSRNL